MTALPVETGSFSGDERLTRAQPGPGCDVARPIKVGVVLAAEGQTTVSCRGLVHLAPQAWQSIEV